MANHQPYYTQTFIDCLEKHREQQNRALEVVSRICETPLSRLSHLLDLRNGIDLRGKRRRHVSGNFVII